VGHARCRRCGATPRARQIKTTTSPNRSDQGAGQAVNVIGHFEQRLRALADEITRLPPPNRACREAFAENKAALAAKAAALASEIAQMDDAVRFAIEGVAAARDWQSRRTRANGRGWNSAAA
jgi:hypothetical protein